MFCGSSFKMSIRYTQIAKQDDEKIYKLVIYVIGTYR